MCVLNREVERSSVTMEAFTHQHRLDQEKIENLSNKVRQLERTVNMRDLQLSETDQLLRELQFCTYDGVFVWKITDFARRRQDAVAGRTPAMFSPGMTKTNTWSFFFFFHVILEILSEFRSWVLNELLAVSWGEVHWTTPCCSSGSFLFTPILKWPNY